MDYTFVLRIKQKDAAKPKTKKVAQFPTTEKNEKSFDKTKKNTSTRCVVGWWWWLGRRS